MSNTHRVVVAAPHGLPTAASPSLTLFIFSPLSLSGLSPAESEFNYLNTARTLELYGVELHYARVSLLTPVC